MSGPSDQRASPQRVTNDAFDLDRHLFHLRNDGFTVLDGLIPADEVDRIRESVWRTVQEQRHNYPHAPKGIAFAASLINHNQLFVPYLAHPHLMAIAGAVLGEHLKISFCSGIVNEPGNARGTWHADWPFNQRNAGRIRSPYPDCVMHLTTLWMLNPFTDENGGTLVVPGSHRIPNNPTGDNGVPRSEPYPTELRVTGPAGNVVVFDSRLWHAPPTNLSSHPRVALAVRYAPWWLDVDVLTPGTDQRKRMVDETGEGDNVVPALPRDVFDHLPDEVKPLFRHIVAGCPT